MKKCLALLTESVQPQQCFDDLWAPVGKRKGNDTISYSPGRDGTTQDSARMAGTLDTFGFNTCSERSVSGQAQA